ncbi:YdcF family protein [Paenibacillus humicola]|uniref:YdcF family protein n=1 Tax=Paenibacillus humicola TaxID=3110540 RepID=UPI00237B6630|nr:YdcF family protein [Paenibacillus humicola]
MSAAPAKPKARSGGKSDAPGGGRPKAPGGVKPKAPGGAKPKARGKRRKKRRFRPAAALLRTAAVLVSLGAFWCAYLLWVIAGYELPKPIPKADAAIVLGAALWNDVPSPGLQERLDHAAELYKQGNVGYLLLTGGLDHNGSRLTEAEGMRDYLLKKGIPKGRLVLENDARSTYENLKFSQPLIAKHGWTSVVIVTHDYHAPRAAEIARYLHYKPDTAVLGYKSKVLPLAQQQLREVLAFTKWKLDSVLLRFGLQTPDAFF